VGSERYAPPAGSIPTLSVPSLDDIRRVHMIGIGGAGMRNLARLLLARGVSVGGSDLKDSKGLSELRDLGAQITVGHDATSMGDPDVVIVSSAIGERNVELLEADRRAIPVWARAQALGALAADRRAVAVCGTHGKTTTTSMLAVVLERAGQDPTFLVGGDLNESGSGARSGAGEVFVFEGDESDGSFLLTAPSIGIVTNVEVDHVDFYPGGRGEIEAAFAAFMARCDRVVACSDDPGVRAAASLAGEAASILYYGSGESADWRLTVEDPGPGGAVGSVTGPEGTVTALRLRVDGAHNLLNATAAMATAAALGVEPSDAAETLGRFSGVHRRFELRGRARGADFYDDYGHVPTELAITLDVARRTGPRRLVAVFQPHRYSRTLALWRELGASLAEADIVVVTDVYGADQDPIPGVTGKLVVDGVSEAAPGTRVVYLPHRHDVVSFLVGEVKNGDLVITMGCGDVWMLADAALASIGEGSV
jgi:UDP-N-acetylmuramate--alanine ligase